MSYDLFTQWIHVHTKSSMNCKTNIAPAIKFIMVAVYDLSTTTDNVWL